MNVFDESARVKRVDIRMYFAFAVFSLIIACAAGFLIFTKYVRPNLSPLQRVYYFQFKSSFLASFNPFAKSGKYLTFTRVVTDTKSKKPLTYWCTEDQMVAQLDDNGRVKFQQNVPQFLLRHDVPVDKNKFYFNTGLYSHEQMYEFFKTGIYESSYPGLFLSSSIAGAVIFGFSFFGMSLLRHKFIAHKLRGKFVRGKRLLSPAEYSRELKNTDGIGIKVRPFDD